MKRLLTIGHSYVVGANRMLAHHLAVEGAGDWVVTAVAPAQYRGDLGTVSAMPFDAEACTLRTVPVRLDRVPHFMWYGAELHRILSDGWDVIHCWEEPYILAGAQVARSAPRGATLVPATFQNLRKTYPWPFSAFERSVMRRADGWIAFGQTIHDALAPGDLYAARPSRVIPPGVDVERFRPDARLGFGVRETLGWTDDDLVVGFLGRFVPEKGLATLMNALDASRAPWRALFVGGGPNESELRGFAARHPSRVHVETSVAHDDVPRWLNAMSVLCAPSRTTAAWREQFGRMLIEAMACGVPVIASNCGEMPAVLGTAGLVVGERDVAAWAAAIDRLLGSAAVRADYAASGRARAVSAFAWPVVARAHLAFFEALLGGRA
jgi:phosphatidylinositol alpha-1,6-mannosyltransferase